MIQSMSCRMYFRLGILTILAISCSSPLLFAQSQPCANTDSSSNVPTQKTRITIVGVEFQNETIRRLNGSNGYIDATPEPDTTIYEKYSRIDLLIKMDQQKPYRIAKLEFVGLPTKTQSELTPPQQIGDFFNPALWRAF